MERTPRRKRTTAAATSSAADAADAASAGDTSERRAGRAEPRPGKDALSERNRDRIVEAALQEFADRGFDGATTAGVARRAGVTQPLVHYHFENKDELWRAAVGRVIQQLDAAFGSAHNELRDLSPVDRLKVLVRRFVYFSAAHPEFGRILSYEGATGGERLDWLLRQQATAQLRVFGQLLEDGAGEGWIKPLAMEHVATCLGAAAAYLFIVKATMRQLYDVDVEAPETIERHADTVVELFFNGLLAAAPARRGHEHDATDGGGGSGSDANHDGNDRNGRATGSAREHPPVRRGVA